MELDESSEAKESAAAEATSDLEFYRMEEEDLADLPTSLIVTNVPAAIFHSDQHRASFQALFASNDQQTIKFEYFRSFKRVRVTFATAEATTAARIQLDYLEFMGQPIRCFFAQILTSDQPMNDESTHLSLPPLEKLFLISPPASPPVGWEPIPEDAPKKPAFNFELLAKLASCAQPDCIFELQAAQEHSPAIIIYPASDQELESCRDQAFRPKVKIPLTPCPERKTNN